MADPVRDEGVTDANGIEMKAISTEDKALEVEGLQTYFYTRRGIVKAVDDVSFSLGRGETRGQRAGGEGCVRQPIGRARPRPEPLPGIRSAADPAAEGPRASRST